ncbi:MAG: hypothetical protein WCZ89_00505 [Phycisphaerae bacterium]
MLTLRNKTVIGILAGAVLLFCVSNAFGRSERGNRSESRSRDSGARQSASSRPERNQSTPRAVQQAPQQTRTFQRNIDSSNRLTRNNAPARSAVTIRRPMERQASQFSITRPTARNTEPARAGNITGTPSRQVNNPTTVGSTQNRRSFETVNPAPRTTGQEPVNRITQNPSSTEAPRETVIRTREDRTSQSRDRNITTEPRRTSPRENIQQSSERTFLRPIRENQITRTDRITRPRTDNVQGNTNPQIAVESAKPARTDSTVTAERASRPERRDFDSRRDSQGRRDSSRDESRTDRTSILEQTSRPSRRDSSRDGSRTDRANILEQTSRSERRDFDRSRHHGTHRSSNTETRRPKVVNNQTVVVNNTTVYRDYYNPKTTIYYRGSIWGHHPRRVFTQVIWPTYYYPVYYSYGPRIVYHYVRPYYHRKYVFVSIGGWWPSHYSSVRYYWYGWHPYYWYGSYPAVYEVAGNTYNYYTYNTYTAAPDNTAVTVGPLASVDETTFADVRERLAQQAQQTPQKTDVDKLFEEGVLAFEQGNYRIAADALANAAALEPDDLILPFAYAQALFADDQFYEAADVIRGALAKLPPDQQGIFFPRGLYTEDEILFKQIERLENRINILSQDGNLKLLLAYQYLGTEQYDLAEETLAQAALYPNNAQAAQIMLSLIEKIRDADAN